MTSRMTGIRPRNIRPEWIGRGVGFQMYGRKTRAELIRRYRQHYLNQAAEAEYALSLSDDELIVETYLGPMAQNDPQEVTDG